MKRASGDRPHHQAYPGEHSGFEAALGVGHGRLQSYAARSDGQGRIDGGDPPLKVTVQAGNGKVHRLSCLNAVNLLLGQVEIEMQRIVPVEADNGVTRFEKGAQAYLTQTECAGKRSADQRVGEIGPGSLQFGLGPMHRGFVALQLLGGDCPAIRDLSVALVNLPGIEQVGFGALDLARSTESSRVASTSPWLTTSPCLILRVVTLPSICEVTIVASGLDRLPTAVRVFSMADSFTGVTSTGTGGGAFCSCLPVPHPDRAAGMVRTRTRVSSRRTTGAGARQVRAVRPLFLFGREDVIMGNGFPREQRFHADILS